MRNSIFRLPLVLTAIVLVVGTSGRFLAQTPSDALERELDPIATCDVELVPGGSGTTAQNNLPTNYKLINSGDRGIKTIVIVGIPGTSRTEIYPGDFLRPGEAFVHNASTARPQRVARESKATLDLVLLSDGTTCGPDTAERSHYLTALFAGEKEAIIDLRSLVGTDADDAAISAWLSTALEGDSPNGIDRSENVEWRKGFAYGYKHALRPFATDLGPHLIQRVTSRIRMVEETLRNADAKKSSLKQ